MLLELSVRNLGVVEAVDLVLPDGLIALTGETGAGKTLVVEALGLLLGGRADPQLVRPGADEALVEGRFVSPDGQERTLARAVPAEGRSRAWLDGRMAPVAALAEAGAELVEIHGQHGALALTAGAVQRAALDRFAAIDDRPLRAARQALRDLEARLAAAGGDPEDRARRRERLQATVAEVEEAQVQGPEEEAALAEEEAALADVAAHREAALAAASALVGEPGGEVPGALDALGAAASALADLPVFAELRSRLKALAGEVDDLALELRRRAEGFEEDPLRLAEVRARRHLLRRLARRYGGQLADALAAAEEARAALWALAAEEEELAQLAGQRTGLLAELADLTAQVAEARRAAAPRLAQAVADRLASLGMEAARFEVAVTGEAGEDVSFLLGPNPGEPPQPLAKAASGGELARAMLALRLVLSESPPTMVFDEVDAGIGGTAALAVGRALAELAQERQVLVVTHLPQVAAAASAHLVVRKEQGGGRTRSLVQPVSGEARLTELARMLSGQPDSPVARRHAAELLAAQQDPSSPSGVRR
ncbi:DNA repair protein RecN [Aciditerrimonas ferrireducens]|nr:DNA repair protein RecN [Aciditerrimonas ferrireducens]MCK4176706.1 DNA repair protein RecN [Aciditerrimonas ferrireducens]